MKMVGFLADQDLQQENLQTAQCAVCPSLFWSHMYYMIREVANSKTKMIHFFSFSTDHLRHCGQPKDPLLSS